VADTLRDGEDKSAESGVLQPVREPGRPGGRRRPGGPGGPGGSGSPDGPGRPRGSCGTRGPGQQRKNCVAVWITYELDDSEYVLRLGSPVCDERFKVRDVVFGAQARLVAGSYVPHSDNQIW